MSPLQQTKLILVENLHLAKDALHIYIALIVFFGSCFLFKWKATQWKPWLTVLAATLIGEVWDVRDGVVYDTGVNLWVNWKDVWNTMLTPTVLMLAARHSSVFGKD